MNALERIKEIESYKFERSMPVPSRWSPGALPMEIAEDFKFLLKACNVYREIAVEASDKNFFPDDRGKTPREVNDLFEKRMKE